MSTKRPEPATYFYGGCDRLDKADIVLAGFPYDCTASFRAGARFGPRDLRVYPGDGLETFSFYFGEDLEECAYFDAGDMEPVYGDPLPVIDSYRAAARGLMAEGRPLIGIGGEHLITYPLFLAARELYGDFTMLQLDAHADLAVVNHVGSRVAHGTVMNLCLEAGLPKLIQYGIRSGNRQEYERRRDDTRISPASSIDEIGTALSPGEKLYLTLDIDFFDPAFVPGTGTPEAGGASFEDFIRILRLLRERKVRLIGCDLNELAPELDASRNSTVFAAKALRELILTQNRLR